MPELTDADRAVIGAILSDAFPMNGLRPFVLDYHEAIARHFLAEGIRRERQAGNRDQQEMQALMFGDKRISGPKLLALWRAAWGFFRSDNTELENEAAIETLLEQLGPPPTER